MLSIFFMRLAPCRFGYVQVMSGRRYEGLGQCITMVEDKSYGGSVPDWTAEFELEPAVDIAVDNAVD
jgi:hypothetical protein